ncbi:mannose-1-phosphate guanylyltransferase/mannose-6-phosphate isomerase [Falsirhodobacter algicola]|uniref:mannose-1-phosphate guanylyltransferase n=1 Tax=Falsirhodobacter algicola TaxID=2692330 RepID=A0A8J8MRH5_9RHOB|nr:mannose-1-phosphate guanylyltransferase/mannose-6-phosphate isomerase [Falsirhodobacter algicola]QUS35122.1 mannose-1-phosphate guanylyltransferase/mannose-6-phosphate isomerase [Falsirhodobacter algicola]
MPIVPVILCGGSGTRLWPLSRKSHPKQFTHLIGDVTLFQAAALRLSGPDFAAPLIATSAEFRFVVQDQLAEAGIAPDAILIEPDARNTAAPVLAAALHLAARDPDAVMLVSPSDHVVEDAERFAAAIRAGLEAVAEGRIVTFGIAPDRAETGYGWLELPSPPGDAALPLTRFVEKPDRATARAMLEEGRFLWNAGIFLARAADLLEAYRRHAPALVPPVAEALEGGSADLGFFRLAPGQWAQAEAISIDYAVMEKAANLSVVPFRGGWSDLGGWDAVWRAGQADAAGVVTFGPATAIDSRDTLLRSEHEGQRIVGIGLEGMIAVAMPDAVLIAPMDRAQDVRLAVSALKAEGAPQAETLPRDHRPWGWFECLGKGPRFQVKRIVVHPGASLSLQSHFHRAEHWIVVEGTARVTVDGEVRLVTENQSIYVPLGATHRMENPGRLPMVLIEVQTGAYLGEDDIVRHEDVYARGPGAKG